MARIFCEFNTALSTPNPQLTRKTAIKNLSHLTNHNINNMNNNIKNNKF